MGSLTLCQVLAMVLLEPALGLGKGRKTRKYIIPLQLRDTVTQPLENAMPFNEVLRITRYQYHFNGVTIRPHLPESCPGYLRGQPFTRRVGLRVASTLQLHDVPYYYAALRERGAEGADSIK